MMDINAIRDYLIEKYNPHAIILHGSRLRGDACDNSDYDITLVVDDTAGILPHAYNGCTIDLGAILPAHDIMLAAGRTPIQPLKILFDDKDGFGQKIAARTEIAFNNGAENIPPDEWQNRQNYTDRLIAKIMARGEDVSLRRYYLSDFYVRVIRYWFEKNKRWTQSPSLALPVIQKNDPEFYSDLQKIWADDYRWAINDIRQKLFS